MTQLEMGVETNVIFSWMLTRKEDNKEIVLLLRNLSAIESKKLKKTIEMFLNFGKSYFSPK